MRYFLDTEFLEDGRMIDLISIAIAADDERVLYLTSNEFNLARVQSMDDPWLRQNVLPHLPPPTAWVPRATIRDQILAFVGDDKDPEFWGYFADYDWVALCQLWGRMIDLPKHFPKYCLDLKQFMRERGVKKDQLPKQAGAVHDAAADAVWIRNAHAYLTSVAR